MAKGYEWRAKLQEQRTGEKDNVMGIVVLWGTVDFWRGRLIGMRLGCPIWRVCVHIFDEGA